MIHRNICPICGSENPEGSVVCQVCKANLQNLPDDMFPSDPEPVEKVLQTGPEIDPPEENEPDLDSPVPSWLQTKLQQRDKDRKVDFESYADALFGMQPSAPQKTPRPKKPRKTEPVYQPSLGGVMESPLVEPDSGTEAAEPKNMPSLRDFSNNRPAKKWDDPKRDPVISNTREQTRRAFQTVVQIPLLWQQDAPLTEDDSPEEAAKTTDADDAEYINSVSPMKVMEPETAAEAAPAAPAPDPALVEESAPAPAVQDDYKPDSGSLLSDLMNEINSNSVTPAPQENKNKENGTVFFSGNQKEEEKPAEILPDPIPEEEETMSSAAALDRILRDLGYQTENEVRDPVSAEPALVEPEEEQKEEEKPAEKEEPEKRDEFIPEDTSEDAKQSEDIETKIPDKEDSPDEPDIPWDLFGSQDMTLPQSPEDPSFRTFSRSGIPAEAESSTYQQRMMSSILGKIIDAENFVPPRKKTGERSVSLPARLFWSLIALGGVVLILLTGITDRIELPALPADPKSEAFYLASQDAGGNAMVILDYTPAYGAELDAASDQLISDLEESAESVSLACLNPAAMPRVQQVLREHEKIEFAGWWPAGAVSIRSNLMAGIVPEQVWLVTSESGSLRNWAEQIAVSGSERKLYVIASGQLEPLLDPYLESGMVAGAVSRDRDLQHYGEKKIPADLTQAAVLYLAALLPLAWLGGLFTKFLKSDPNYGMKKTKKAEHPLPDPEKEAMNDGRL